MNCLARLDLILFFVVFSALTATFVSAQKTAEPFSRTITSQDFQTKRPSTFRAAQKNKKRAKMLAPVTNQKRRKNIAVITNAGRLYKHVKRTSKPKSDFGSDENPVTAVKSVTSDSKMPAPPTEEELGITFWRLRPAKNHEADAPTFKVDSGDGVKNWTAERVRSTTKFKFNDRVRFTVESLRSGFLYIINREVFADGATGEAELVYPKMQGRVRQNNRVVAGSLVEIPTALEELPYFKITPKSKNYVGEEVIVIISPTQIAGFNVGAEIQSVKRSILQKWFDEWASASDVYDADDGEGIAYTRTEAEAVSTRALTQEEPLPQTIYRFKSRTGKPLMVSFFMQVKQFD